MSSRKSFKLSEIAALTKSELIGDPDCFIEGVADLERASITEASFLENPRYEQAMQQSKAGVVFVQSKDNLPSSRNFLVNENPSLAFQVLIDEFFKEKGELTGFQGIHPTAIIHETCKLGAHVKIGPHAVLDKDVVIGDHTHIGAGVYIGPHTEVGQECVIHAKAVVRERCKIGNRVIIQPGAVIGSCGFGYVTNKQGVHVKLSQLGIVVIEDDVEIGANTTIDRSRFEVTTIKKGSKIDNLVQIGHNVTIGPYNIIVAQTGIAGSTKTGRHVVMGGQVAVAGHLKIGDGVMFAARSGVTKSFTKAGKYGGVPAQPLDEHNRNNVFIHQIEKHIKKLEAKIEAIREFCLLKEDKM